LVADDSFGFCVAKRLKALALDNLEVVATTESGFNLLDHVVGAPRLVVIDTVLTHAASPGTIYRLQERELKESPGAAIHGIGLLDVLGLGRKLGLEVATDVVFIVVEAADLVTVGGAMHPAVLAAVRTTVDMVLQMLHPGPHPAA